MQTNIDAYGLCVQPERCSIADISTTRQNGTKNHDLSCFVSDCRSMAGTGVRAEESLRPMLTHNILLRMKYIPNPD